MPPFSGGSGEDEVVRELGERRVSPAARKRLKRPGDPKMQLAPDRPGQGRIEHVADQRMREAPRSAWGARLRQGVGGDALVEEHDELARGTVLERRHQIERDFDADDRSAGKDLPTVIAQPREPPTDDGLHPFGHP